MSPNNQTQTPKTLRKTLPQEFFQEFLDTPAAKLLDQKVVRKCEHPTRWPGKHKNIHVFWVLANGKAVGWNENPGKGWSFPVIGANHLLPSPKKPN